MPGEISWEIAWEDRLGRLTEESDLRIEDDPQVFGRKASGFADSLDLPV